MPNNPLTDEQLAELDRLHAAANIVNLEADGSTVYSLENGCNDAWFGINVKGNHPKHAERRVLAARAIAALHNAYPALRQRLTDAESRLAEAERERDELRNAVDYYSQQFQWIEENGETYTKEALLDFIRRTTSNTDWEKVLAARDAQQRREGAAEWLRGYIIAVKLQDPMAEMVWLSALEQAAQRLREGGE